MDASAKGSAFGLGAAVIVGLVLIVSSGFVYIKIGRADSRLDLLEEVFKISLAFTFTAMGGALVKAILDADAKHRAELKAKAEARQQQQVALIRELAEVFSGFYTVRKQHDSLLGHVNFAL